MRAKKVENISNSKIELKFASGQSATLPPGSKVEHVEITNEQELKGKAHIVRDLTEVVENKSKMQLRD